ncbi:MAG TPA: hypothetical protein VK558_03825 [Patescibacteria group bacterium]|nr:hypothetical protein [Patescibacteria group bacterium]
MSSVCKPASIVSEKSPIIGAIRSRPRNAANRFLAREEPALGDLLDDPMTRRLMASDGVRLDHLMDVIAQAKSGLADR